MKYILSALLCFSMFAATAQQIDEKQLKDNIAQLDSTNKALNESIAKSMHRMDSENTARSIEQMNRNMSSFLAERKEQERKQMRGAYIRIGFGVLMLVVLIVGLLRKKKKKE